MKLKPSPEPSLLHIGQDQRRYCEGPMELMRANIEPMFHMKPIGSAYNRGLYRSWNWCTKNAYFLQSQNDAVTVHRDKAHAEAGGHLVYVMRYLEGGSRGYVGDFSVDRRLGAIYVFDQANRAECIQFPAMTQGFLIEKSVLGYTPDRHTPHLCFPKDTPIGRVLFAQFDRVFDSLHRHNGLDEDRFDQIISCLKLALGTDVDHDDVRRRARDAMTEVICAYIEQNLESDSLSVTNLLKNFGVSRASLYRMFEDRGGVRQYISDRRVYRAVLDLSAGPLSRGEVSKISEKWGFSSNANFNRAVRRQFGVAPGTLVNMPMSDRDFTEAATTLNSFISSAQLGSGPRTPSPPTQVSDSSLRLVPQ